MSESDVQTLLMIQLVHILKSPDSAPTNYAVGLWSSASGISHSTWLFEHCASYYMTPDKPKLHSYVHPTKSSSIVTADSNLMYLKGF